MNSFKLLLKTTLINNLGINKLQKKKNSGARLIGAGAIASIIYFAILAFITLYMFLFTMLFQQVGNTEEISNLLLVYVQLHVL